MKITIECYCEECDRNFDIVIESQSKIGTLERKKLNDWVAQIGGCPVCGEDLKIKGEE